MNSFFTQATNFGSAVSGGVDPRTGLFNARLALGEIVGNRNLGPSLPLVLGYSPLTSADVGFGRGVSPGLTTYDTDDRLLVLSTGEQYKIQETATNVVLRQHKLDTVHVTKDRDSYRIAHKSGDVEVLTGPRNAVKLKVPTALLTPSGHGLTLTWDFSGPQPRLQQIRDENDVLLSVDHTATSKTTLHVLPGQPEGYDVELRFRNGLLDSAHHLGLGAGTPLVWNFTYTPMGQRGEWGSWLTGVTMPGGMSETAYYRNDGRGHQFPVSAGLPALPFVERFTQSPGGGQPTVETTYSYTDNNFLGGHSGVGWDSGRDNLYEVLSDYSYGSTESLVCAGRTTTTVREYDRYHLQTAETTRRNGCSRGVAIDYHAVVGRPFDQQPAQFQLPKKRTVTWTDDRRQTRDEVTLTGFDAAGNPQSRTEPDGTATAWEYYPAGGSGDDCPPEPNGFTRLLAAVTRTPPPTDFDAPVHRTSYRYAAHRGTPDSRVGTAVLKSAELHHADDEPLHRKDFTYGTSGPEFGRVTGVVETEYAGDGTPYAATHAFGFSVRGDALLQTHSVTTHDRLTTTRSETRSRFTGRLRSTTDPQANVTTATYDGLGRLLTRTLNPDTPYQAVESRAYAMGGDAPFVVTTADALGNQLRESLDGAGRPIRRERRDVDGDGAWYTVQELGYDEQGRVSSISDRDHVRGGGAIGLVRTFAYDDWGLLSTTTGDDGTGELTRHDPVRRTTTTQLLGGGTPVSGTEVTTHDTRGEPVSVERFDLAGASAGRRLLERDGWGRPRRETDELGHVTSHDYDARDRLVRTTLPDGTLISREHAPFSPDVLITGLAVDGTPYGAQRFDGLGRLTGTTSGGRTWSFDYAATGDPVPSSVTAPDGQLRTYRFVPQLDNALSQVQAGPVTQRFTRDPVTGSVTTALADGAAITRDHYPSGLLRTDTTSLPDQPDGTTQYDYTVNGLDQGHTGVDGTTEQITRDDHGRISAVTDPAVRASLGYDTAGRLTGWTALDRQSGHTLTTALDLDDFGREVRRTITDDRGASWTLTQAWQADDLLSRRTFSRDGTVLRDESFAYDSRGRLTGYTCDGTSPPLDEHGNAVTRQSFTYDGHGNLTRCVTEFPGGSDTATHLFENPADPCQPTGVRHTHPAYPARVDLRYDAAGRLVADDAGRALAYDALGRLRSVGPASRYGYDPLNRLVTQETGDGTSVLHYRGDTLASVVEGDRRTRLLQLDQACVAQRSEGARAETRLFGTDGKRTVLVAGTGGQHEEYAYTAYGSRSVSRTADAAGASALGYDGERVDPALGWSYLGNGYRAYSPALMRFTAPDSESPFGAGGINPYAYCLGDPVNRVDPSGHLSWQAWLAIGLGVAGLALTVVTGGLAIAAAGGVVAAVSAASTTTLVVGALGVASDVTAIVGGALEEASPKASSVLGWVSLGTGLAGLAEAGVRMAGRLSGLARRSPELAEDLGRSTRSALRSHDTDVVWAEVVPDERQYDDLTRFKYVRNRGRRRVWLTKYAIYGDAIRPYVESALRRRRPLTILSGTHGGTFGYRTTRSAARGFFNDDWAMVNSLREQRGFPRGLIKVVDTSGLSWRGLRRILHGDREVIAAFCHSRNDVAIRRILGLDADVSYVLDEWLH
ncbi:RHS repeat-associated core domain-containing protein [Saccharothrix syringae]|uniref:RHS repeat-associated core domain-containing protein n=1 Tax=Saccharothrix syringae TaxID=103733 RepID=A0A5Q0H638_SACSY|nr:RHS repeat-associated core domain-containing protein [Saccharothrix syringae]QFZ21404.1 hypothetical protein EKG83_32065 [Saccharothrix syringae]